MPSDIAKLKRITLDKIIPKLCALMHLSESGSPWSSTSRSLEMAPQKRQKQKEFYMKELFMIKCIIDFKIHYHRNSSPTTSNS